MDIAGAAICFNCFDGWKLSNGKCLEREKISYSYMSIVPLAFLLGFLVLIIIAHYILVNTCLVKLQSLD